MKAKEVLQILRVTRPTLTKYVKEGLVKVTVKTMVNMIMTQIVCISY